MPTGEKIALRLAPPFAFRHEQTFGIMLPTEGEIYLRPFQGCLTFSLFRQSERIDKNVTHLSNEELFLVVVTQQLFTSIRPRMRLKLNTLPPFKERLTLSDSARISLQKWETLQMTLLAHNDAHAHDALNVAFTQLFEDFCEKSTLFQKLAHALYTKGFFTRLNLSKENFERTKKAYPFRLPPISFIDLLASCQRHVEEEGKT